MMVIRMAMTPSLKASSRPLLMAWRWPPARMSRRPIMGGAVLISKDASLDGDGIRRYSHGNQEEDQGRHEEGPRRQATGPPREQGAASAHRPPGPDPELGRSELDRERPRAEHRLVPRRARPGGAGPLGARRQAHGRRDAGRRSFTTRPSTSRYQAMLCSRSFTVKL